MLLFNLKFDAIKDYWSSLWCSGWNNLSVFLHNIYPLRPGIWDGKENIKNLIQNVIQHSCQLVSININLIISAILKVIWCPSTSIFANKCHFFALKCQMVPKIRRLPFFYLSLTGNFKLSIGFCLSQKFSINSCDT